MRARPAIRASRGVIVALTVALVCALAATAIATNGAAPCNGCQAWGRSLAWGAWFEDSVPWRLSPVQSFDKAMGQPMSVIQFGAPWAQCSGRHCRWFIFPFKAMRRIWNRGAIPMLSWSSQSVPTSLNEPNFRLSKIASGAYDKYLRRWAQGAAKWGHPFFLRFDWEMNGNWFPWGQRVNHNRPADFVAAWRHVHDIFAAAGATSVTWVWCPNTDNKRAWYPMERLYPGDQYVDWTCLDAYNFGPERRGAGGWLSFHTLVASSYQRAERLGQGKPMILGEVASVGRGGNRAKWISDMFNEIPKDFPLVKGVVWFQRYESGLDFPIPLRSSSAKAFAAGVKHDEYSGGGALCPHTAGPIPGPVASAAACH